MLNDKTLRWLVKQPKEFVEEILQYGDVLGNGDMTIDKLRELDDKYINNPED